MVDVQVDSGELELSIRDLPTIPALIADALRVIDDPGSSRAEMDKVVQQNAASSEESASASEELSSQAEELKGMVGELLAMVVGARARDGVGVPADRNRPGRYISLAHASPAERSPKPKPPAKALSSKAAPGRTAKAEDVIPLDDDELSRF